MKKRGVKIPLLSLLIIFLIGCKTKQTAQKEAFYVLTTTGMLGDAVNQLAGNFVKVESLMGVGVDPHLYKATQQDIKKLQQADLIVYNGLHLEGKLQDILHKLEKVRQVHNFSDKINPDLLLRDEQNNAVDPHIWFDMEIWKEGLNGLAEKLKMLLPDHSEAIDKNLSDYIQIINQKTDSLKMLTATIPEKKRVLITSHDAFRYFGRAFGLEVFGLQGISTATELGIRDRMTLVDFIIKRQIPTVFIETTVSSKPMEAVMEDCRSKGHEVKLGGALLSDALGDANKGQHTLLGMLTYNITTVVNELNK